MGTKKTPLSYEASLGACISFAGHVLGSPLTPSQVCTKGALASIVVEAHRLGQQIGKAYSAGNAANKKTASVDPRKLLKQMQMSHREPEWDRPDDAMITGLVFQDLTWDSQGNVTDMLEMELLELELRARESNTSVCVLLSLTSSSAKQSAVETAILWLPVDNPHGNSSDSSKKKQYLLYVCPGRVKVVKSVLELLKKLHDDVQTMHATDAIYSIWTLSRRATTDINTKKTLPSNQQGELEKANIAEKQVRCIGRENAVPLVRKHASKKEIRYEQLLEAAEEEETLQKRRSFITREALSAQCPAIRSIFTFPWESQEKVRPLKESSSASGMNPLDNMHEEIYQSGACKNASVPSMPKIRILDARDDEERVVTGTTVVSPRPTISVSCSSFLPTKARPHEPCDKSDEQYATTWRSLDSKLNKLPVKVDRRDSEDTVISYDCAEKEELRTHVRLDYEESESSTTAQILVCTPAVVKMDGRNEDPYLQFTKVPADAKEIEVEAASSIFMFLQKPAEKQESSTSVPFSTSAKMDAVNSARNTQLASSLLLSNKEEGCVSNGLDSYETQQFTADAFDPETTMNNMMKTPEAAMLESTSSVPTVNRNHIDNSQVAKTGLKNFKSKLGNRVWWELQCAAQTLQAELLTKDTVKMSNCGTRSHVAATVKSPKDSTTRTGASNKRHTIDLSKVRGSGEPLQSHLTVEMPSMNTDDPVVHPALPSSITDSSQSPSPASLNSKKLLEAMVSDNDKLIQVSREYAKSSGGIATPCILSSASHTVERGCEDRQQPQLAHTFEDSVIKAQTTMQLVDCMAEQRQDLKVSVKSQAKAPPTPPSHCLTKSQDSNAKISQWAAPPPTPQSAGHKRALQNQSQPAKQTMSAVNARMDRTKESSEDSELLPSLDNVLLPTKRPSRWSFTAKDGCDDDGDDDLAQNQWASTRTSYLREDENRNTEKDKVGLHQPLGALQFTDHESTKTPFNVHGRVPIRAQKTPSLPGRDARRTMEDNSSVEDRHDAHLEHDTSRRNSPRLSSNNNFKNSDAVAFVDSQQVNELRGKSSKQIPHVATFIPIDLEGPVSKRNVISGGQHYQPTREEKLAELRQKKLQQLHKARKESLANLQQQQQQKQKRALEKTHSTFSAFGGVMEHESSSTATTSLSATKTGKKPSNRKLIQNALEYTLLAGGSMERDRLAALQAMTLSTCENFIVLLKSTRELKFRALYEHHTDRQHVVKLFALTPNSPPVLTCDVIGQFFKYNTGKKEFTAIDSRSFTMRTDACALKDEIVFKKKNGNIVTRLL